MKKIFLIAFFIFLTSIVWGQKAMLKGKITSNQKPVEFASVLLKGINQGTNADENGDFNLSNIPFGEYKISVSAVGFLKKEQSVSINSSEIFIQIELSPDNTLMQEVVVTGTLKEVSKLDSPVPVEIYNKTFFKSNPTPSIFESLQNVNGVRPQLNCNICNTGDIHINGLEGPYTMVLIDGMPIVSGLSTVYGMTGIPQSLIERVEIVKGPASTLYGSEAMGGLINVITKKTKNAPTLSADVFSSTWMDVNADLGFKFDIGKSESIVGLNYFNYQNPVDNNADGFTDLTLQNRVSAFNKWSFNRKQNRLFSLAGRYVYEDRWGGQMIWTKANRGGDEVYGESIYTKRWEVFGTYQLPFSEKVLLQFSLNNHYQNSVYGNTPYLAKQNIGFGQLLWDKKLGINDLLLGAAYRYTYYDDNTPATQTYTNERNQPSVIHLPGLFLQDEIRLNESNKLLLGLRFDHNSIHGNVFTPRLNYKYSSKNKLNTLRLSIGNGYRVANVFTEDHAALTGARQVVFADALKPEKSWNTNLNFTKNIIHSNGFIGLDASVFYTHFSNRILPDYETNPNQIIYDNLSGFAVSKGVSLNLDMSFTNGLKIMAGSTLMDVSLTENGLKKRQLLTERFSGVWTISYKFNKANLTIDYTGNLYGKMKLPLLSELDDRPAESPVYSLQNIQLTKIFNKKWEIYGGIKNLLNFLPPANSIARPFDPFDKNVIFDTNGQVIPTADNPKALTFDPSYVFAPNQGRRFFVGVRFGLE
jgi:outer membrane receptor for ferrienterochelin and colicins